MVKYLFLALLLTLAATAYYDYAAPPPIFDNTFEDTYFTTAEPVIDGLAPTHHVYMVIRSESIPLLSTTHTGWLDRHLCPT